MKIFICDIYFTTVFRVFFYLLGILFFIFVFSGNGGNVDMRYFYDEEHKLH